jgi:hypothetical protein
MSIDTSIQMQGIKRTVKTSVNDGSGDVEVFLDIDYSECSLEDVLEFANKNRTIAWANVHRAKGMVGIVKGTHVKVTAKSPGTKAPMDLDTFIAMSAKAANLTIEEFLNRKREELKARSK